jgi:uncharacterized protein YkwD
MFRWTMRSLSGLHRLLRDKNRRRSNESQIRERHYVSEIRVDLRLAKPSGNRRIRVKICEGEAMRLSTQITFFIAIVFSALLTAQAQSSANAAELELVAAVNHARSAQSLPALRWNEALAIAARRHVALMASHGTAEHVYTGERSLAARVTQAGAHFSWVAENVARGSGVEAIQAEFLKSPNHRANILDSDMDSIGVALAEHDGQWFAVEDFSKAK